MQKGKEKIKNQPTAEKLTLVPSHKKSATYFLCFHRHRGYIVALAKVALARVLCKCKLWVKRKKEKTKDPYAESIWYNI